MKPTLPALLLCLGLAAPALAGLTEQQIDTVGLSPPPQAQVPLSLSFRDETGRALTLAEATAGRPSVLLMADYTCETLCGATTIIAAGVLGELGLEIGADYKALVIGIDPHDGPSEAAAAKASELASYPGLAPALPFLSGDAATVGQLTHAIGYVSAYDPERDQFAHPSAVLVLAGDGRVSRVLSGLTLEAGDLRLALVDTAQGRIGTVADRLKLLCYGFDPVHGVYTPAVFAMLRAGSIATVLALGGALLVMRRRDGRRPLPEARP